MKVTILDGAKRARIWALMSDFGSPISSDQRNYAKHEGLPVAGLVGSMGWVWTQWLLGASASVVQQQVAGFLDRALRLRALSDQMRHRARFDLYLLHCAVFAAEDPQLKQVAEVVVDAAGWRGSPLGQEFGELHAGAWCGMMKHSIMGGAGSAAEQANTIWGAQRSEAFSTASKPLVQAWLRADWDEFRLQQRKDFARLWAKARKTSAIKRDTRSEITIELGPIASIEQFWCWAHCGLALLAYRRGVEVATDPLWFPPHALECVNVGP